VKNQKNPKSFGLNRTDIIKKNERVKLNKGTSRNRKETSGVPVQFRQTAEKKGKGGKRKKASKPLKGDRLFASRPCSTRREGNVVQRENHIVMGPTVEPVEPNPKAF